jgi:uncharacterized protein YdbL (DUF1318 family)
MLVCCIAACVTVNIYFPAAEVKKTADEFVDDVYKKDTSESGEEQSSLHRFLEWLGPQEARAQKASQVSNAAIRGLKAQIGEHHSKLEPSYASGAIGITNDGYLTIKDKSKLSLSELGKVRQLVEKDNRARKQLYKEVVKALDLEQSQISRVESIFADTWRSKAASGWWIQKDDGSWTRK